MSILQQVSKKAREHVIRYYGNLLSIDEPVFNRRERLWSVKMKADYPRLIRNDDPEERFVRTLRIRDLGTLLFNEDLTVVKNRSTSRSECVGTLRKRLRTWDDRAESIIVKTSSFQLANTGIARVFLNPISTILANFLQEESAIISFEELDYLRKTQKYLKWIRLLEDMQLVFRTEEGYVYGNMFTEIRRKAKDNGEFLTHVFAYVIRERYTMIKEVFNLTQFEPLVHLDNCYYRPAIEAKKVLYRRAESLFNLYLAQYNHRSKIELPIVLLELRNSQALKQKGRYYCANEELFEKMIKMSEEFNTLSSPKT